MMARFHFTTRSTAAKIAGVPDYRTLFKPDSAADAALIRADGSIVPLVIADPQDAEKLKRKAKTNNK